MADKCISAIKKLQQGEEMVIVAFGDSLTYGWMVEQGYIDVLDSMLRGRYPRALFRIVNRGIPGDTARGGYFRMQRHVIDERPDLVMIQFALNDALSGFSEDDFYGSLSQIVSGVQAETSAEILLLTSPLIYDEEMMNMARPYYDKIVQLGIEKSIPTARVDLYWREKIASGTDHASLVQSDMAHPTETGHRLMAEAAFELLV